MTYGVYNGANKLSRGSGACPPPAKLPEMSCRVLILFLYCQAIHRCVNGGVISDLLPPVTKNQPGMSGCVPRTGVGRGRPRCRAEVVLPLQMYTKGRPPDASTPSLSVRRQRWRLCNVGPPIHTSHSAPSLTHLIVLLVLYVLLYVFLAYTPPDVIIITADFFF